MKKQPETPALSRRERQVMDILHRRGEATVAEIMDELPDPPTYSAVRSVLRILGEKELIRFKEDGPRYVYYPAQATEAAREDVLAHVVQHVLRRLARAGGHRAPPHVRRRHEGRRDRAAARAPSAAPVRAGDDRPMNLASFLASGAPEPERPARAAARQGDDHPLAALGITLAMQRASAGARHLVWLVTLGALLLVPALTAWGPLRLAILPAPSAAPRRRCRRSRTAARRPRRRSPIDRRRITASVAPVGGSEQTAAPSSASTASARTGLLAAIRDASLCVVALTLWAVVALAIVASLAWAALAVRRIVRRSAAARRPVVAHAALRGRRPPRPRRAAAPAHERRREDALRLRRAHADDRASRRVRELEPRAPARRAAARARARTSSRPARPHARPARLRRLLVPSARRGRRPRSSFAPRASARATTSRCRAARARPTTPSICSTS